MDSQFKAKGILLLSSALLLLSPCFCSDPDPLQDFCVADLQSTASMNGFLCKPASAVTSDDFFFAGLTKGGNTSNPLGFGVSIGDVLSFPGINTLGLSMVRADLTPGGVVPPHTHPRATELVLVIKGQLLIGFVTTGNVYYSKVVKAGEIFVIPRGLMHFQYNVGKGKAIGIAVFNSQLPGTVISSTSLFGLKPSIPDEVLAKTFRVDLKVIETIQSKFRS